MSEPVEGGGTVFLSEGVGVRVTPELGMGVLWWNLRRNGEPDERTLHGACPLFAGEKWGTLRPNEHFAFVRADFYL